jgi:hypothetical protein
MVAFSPRLLEKNLFRQLRHIPGQPISYLRNPKVATKTIELSLWRAHDPTTAPGNPHKSPDGPFIRVPQMLSEEVRASLLGSKFFSVVRNPYSRFVSAYLNKVKRHFAWQKTSKRFGMPPKPRPTIDKFVDVVKEADPFDMDPHFRPQHINLMRGFIPLDFVGYLEDMDTVAAFFARHGFTIESNKMNSTSSSERVTDLLTLKAVETIQEVFATDFEIFGYSTDPKQLHPTRPISSITADRDALKRYFVDNTI